MVGIWQNCCTKRATNCTPSLGDSRIRGVGRWIRHHQRFMVGGATLLLTASVALGISTALISHKQAETELARDQEARQRARAEPRVPMVREEVRIGIGGLLIDDC